MARQASRVALRDAIRERLDRFVARDDRAVILAGEAAAQAAQLAALADPRDPVGMESRNLLGWFYYYRCLCLHADEYVDWRESADLRTAVEMFIPCYLSGWDLKSFPESMLPVLADETVPMVSRLIEQAVASTDLRLVSLTIQALERFLSVTPADNVNRPAVLANLSTLLHQRFDLTGESPDLDEAVRTGRESVKSAPHGSLDLARYASNLGNVLLDRNDRAGVRADLDEALAMLDLAAGVFPGDDPDRGKLIASLARARHAEFKRTGALGDLDEAVRIAREALASAGEAALRGALLGQLGYALLDRFEEAGALADLDQAVTAAREAVALTPVSHPDGLSVRIGLGSALRTRAERSGNLADLDEAVRLCRAALAEVPATHAHRDAVLTLLSNSLIDRFERAGSHADLDEAVRVSREALASVPPGRPAWAMYASNSSSKLLRLYERTGSSAALDEAVLTGRAAVDAADTAPGTVPGVATYALNLSGALIARFRLSGAPEDLDEAVRAARKAVALAPAGHHDQPKCTTALAAALEARFRLTGSEEDLNEAVRTAREALSATPPGHPERAAHSSNLGNIVRARYERTGDPQALDEAIGAYAAAAEMEEGPAWVRAWAARGGGTLAAVASRPALAARLFEQAVRLLPEVAPRQMASGDQQYALGRLSGVGADAAAAALSDPSAPAGDRASTALRLLEAGRAVLLSQALEVRGDLAELAGRHPELAARFTQLRDRLDAGPSLAVSQGTSAVSQGTSARDGEERRRLAGELRDVLAQIRAQDGFGAFGRPPTTAELVQQAAEGPVVVPNVSGRRSDALLLTASGVTSLSLPGLRQEDVYHQIRTFHRALTRAIYGTSQDTKSSARQTLNQVLEWLWDACAGPVLDALGFTGQPAAGAPWPRVWWASVGPLGLLPVHAAGYHADPADAAGRRTVLDRVISSYTPTVAALRYARRPGPAASSPALIVAMPTTPGSPGPGSLTFVRQEAKTLAKRLPGSVTLVEPDPGSSAPPGAVPTLANVLAQLAVCPVAHFACHGVNDFEDLSLSRLLLHDHDVAPLTVAALAPLRLDHAQLAYLSACGTAITETDKLTDEAISLASAFQLAGYRHVIGTLWAIGDDPVTVGMASDFYAGLTAALDPGLAAPSLHRAVRAVRDKYPLVPTRWAAHVHAGA